jgi:CRP-like cAMP-binding protein
LSRESLLALRATYRAVDVALLHLLAAEVSLFIEYISGTGHESASRRLAHRLLAAALPDGGKEPMVPLSQAALALMIGTSRQTANHLLRQLAAEGLVSLGYRSITIRDLAGLRDRAG